jgi:hypothetical protein
MKRRLNRTKLKYLDILLSVEWCKFMTKDVAEDEGHKIRLVTRGGKTTLVVNDRAEKLRIREILQKGKLGIAVEEKKDKECPFEPEKPYDESFCGFLDAWLKEEIPGTKISRADALVAVKVAKDEILEAEEEKT